MSAPQVSLQTFVAQALDCTCTHVHWLALDGGQTNIARRRQCACRDVVVKTYLLDRSSPIFRNDPDAEWSALQNLHAAHLAPTPVYYGWHQDQPILIYSFVEACSKSVNPRAAADLLNRLAAHNWAELPQWDLGSATLELRGDEMARHLTSDERSWVAQNRPHAAVLPHTGQSVCHGDFVGSNVLSVSGRPSERTDAAALAIDWQTPYRASAAWDIAMYLSPSMQHRYGMESVNAAEFLSHITDGTTVQHYLDLQAWFHWLLSIYALWRAKVWEDTAAAADFQIEAAALEHIQREGRSAETSKKPDP